MIEITALLFFLLLFLNVPVAFAIALASIPLFILGDFMPATVAIQRMYGSTQSFPLLAVPFFILAGNLMNTTGITARLLDFARLLTGWMVGGLAQVTIVLSALMGGISGSAVADAAMEARILGPAMSERGYAGGFSAAVIAFSSVITATIPPSIGLILFGFIGEVSIGRLLLGAVFPGLLMTVSLMMVTSLISRQKGYAPELPERPKIADVGRGALRCFWALVFPIFLLAGFRIGFFTATEAGAIVVVYALVVGALIYREMTFASFLEALRASVIDTGMVMLIIIMAAVLGHAIIVEQAPQALAEGIGALTSSDYGTFFVVAAALLVAGMVMEATVNVLLLTPLFLPILTSHGFDPVHVGVFMVMLITFGGNTPPVGVIMYTVCGLMKVRFGDFCLASLPFLLTMIVFFAALALIPGIVLFLPNTLM